MSLSVIEEMMTATMTERKRTENHKFMSVQMEKVDFRSFQNYSTTVGGIPLNLHTRGISHTDVNVSVCINR